MLSPDPNNGNDVLLRNSSWRNAHTCAARFEITFQVTFTLVSMLHKNNETNDGDGSVVNQNQFTRKTVQHHDLYEAIGRVAYIRTLQTKF